MAKPKKQGVVAKANVRIRANKDVEASGKDYGIASTSRDELNEVKKLVKEGSTVKGANGRTAYQQAAADAKGTRYDPAFTKRGRAKASTSRSKQFFDVTGTPHAKRKAQMEGSLRFLTDLAKASEPTTPRVKSQLKATQERFEKTPPGPDREKHRRAIGKMIQQGTFEGSGVHQLACQTPGCNRNVPAFPEKGNIGDVVCNNCLSAGDLAGKEYKDKPTNAAN